MKPAAAVRARLTCPNPPAGRLWDANASGMWLAMLLGDGIETSVRRSIRLLSMGTSSTRLGLKLAAAALVALGTTTVTTAAHADEPRGVDWMKALVDLDRFARTGSERPAAQTQHTRARPHATDDPSPHNLGNAWFGVNPRVTLVARDWASSTRIVGDRLSVVESVRLAASTRMVVGRARLSNTRFTPFVQVGVGQWRVDRRYLPFTPANIEVASQLGTGFELRLTPRWQLAAETSFISLIRDGQSDTFPQTVMWSTLVASRLDF